MNEKEKKEKQIRKILEDYPIAVEKESVKDTLDCFKGIYETMKHTFPSEKKTKLEKLFITIGGDMKWRTWDSLIEELCEAEGILIEQFVELGVRFLCEEGEGK